MYKLLRVIVLLLNIAFAQKVGLVLSGGGALGMAHIGVLKALEEHNIPIDYITGTSAGALVGGMYAAGYSPSEMIYLALTQKKEWLGYGLTIKDRPYYKESRNFGTFVKIPISFKSGASFIPDNLVSDYGINLGLTQMATTASKKAKYNFDSLFVPFRAIAADIFDKRIIPLRDGNLAFAIRASISVPLFFLPVSNRLYTNLIDGGIYDNFPVKTMIDEFKPDFIIGVHVGGAPPKREEVIEKDKFFKQLLYQAMDQVQWQKLPENSVYISPDLGNLSATDFSDPLFAIQRGYLATKSCIEDIKSKVPITVDSTERALKRKKFRENFHAFELDTVIYHGISPAEAFYLKNIMMLPKDTISFFHFRKSYYRVRTDGNFRGVFPEFFFNDTSQKYTLVLNVTPQRNFGLRFGGAFFSPTDHQIHVGAYFSKVYYASWNVDLDIERGSFTNFVNLRGRMDLPTGFFPLFFELENMLQSNRYQWITKGLFSTRNASDWVLNSFEFIPKVGFPIQEDGRIFIGYNLFNLNYEYYPTKTFTFNDQLDNTSISGSSTYIALEKNTLNTKMYPTSGTHFYLNLRYNSAFEDYAPGNLSNIPKQSAKHYWFQARLNYQTYFQIKNFMMGFSLQAAYSGLQSLANYRSTLITSPRFLPFQDSQILDLEKFYSKAFAAPGLIVNLALNKKWNVRAEAHWMQSFYSLSQNLPDRPQIIFNPQWNNKAYALTTGFYYDTAVGPLGLFANYYDNAPNPNFRIFLHLGLLLFNRHAWD
ncbi:MAG: patatin [Bacteroidia bacterium]|nr:MAG: patatin [Bacteroidia bacterium]